MNMSVFPKLLVEDRPWQGTAVAPSRAVRSVSKGDHGLYGSRVFFVAMVDIDNIRGRIMERLTLEACLSLLCAHDGRVSNFVQLTVVHEIVAFDAEHRSGFGVRACLFLVSVNYTSSDE